MNIVFFGYFTGADGRIRRLQNVSFSIRANTWVRPFSVLQEFEIDSVEITSSLILKNQPSSPLKNLEHRKGKAGDGLHRNVGAGCVNSG
jgi:hypothetical protein